MMIVAPVVSLAKIKEELEAVAWLWEQPGCSLDITQLDSDLVFTVTMVSRIDGQQYVFEFDCKDYKAVPPAITPIDPRNGERNTPYAFPSESYPGGNIFHAKPVFCIQFNRLAYAVNGGPHGDWPIGNWLSLILNHNTLGEMMTLLWARINRPDTYRGRMQK